jgi:hypothetical protein
LGLLENRQRFNALKRYETIKSLFKKYFMKKTIVLFIAFATFTRCRKLEDPSQYYASKGVITGIDYSMCSGCGGWFFTTNGRKVMIDQFPENIDFDPQKDKMPIPVEYDLEKEVISAGPRTDFYFRRIRKER